jgi:predicted RNA binding protein YcfA (HicA-like mRNA interferase family)
MWDGVANDIHWTLGSSYFFLAFVTIFSYSIFEMGMEKDLFRIKQNPKGVRFNELERVILGTGFKRINIKGSHHVYKKGNRILTLVKPHGGHKHCHWLDVIDVIRILEEE